MNTDLGITFVCTENRSRAEGRRDNLSRREAGQDKRTRHGCHVKSMSAQGFSPHAFFPTRVNGRGRFLISRRLRQHVYAGMPWYAATLVRARG